MSNTFDLEYWIEYKTRLLEYIKYYENINQKDSIENIDFDIELVKYNEKVASLLGEVNRVESVISVLRYKFETDEI